MGGIGIEDYECYEHVKFIIFNFKPTVCVLFRNGNTMFLDRCENYFV